MSRTATKEESLAVTVCDKNIYEMYVDVRQGTAVIFWTYGADDTAEADRRIRSLKEIRARVGFLKDVGLDYLTLARATGTFPVAKHSESVWQHRSVPDWLELLYS